MERIEVDARRCDGCGACAKYCPGDILEMREGVPVAAYPLECWICGVCMLECHAGAIEVHFNFEV
ncbi:MAG: 4Fe-4S binding protein [Actinobacteria bacterium]|nr:4Fe-4S binding protein [Actinomycetota bacterium]MBU1943264.1 4Fe-4S binding protein [Actinomycetota bacterium]MBU2688987.1 4Fe-4S binding protein [Actinomycetota bacterium]